ncbi:50S ribosomal protein L18 [Eisenibacter elegans]|uniref:50S ribosomal protein L18 n=1 Tax=Eisenibacter elegans TaxID=997 RepID=UPI00047C6388|nr:50S ribosomal protein L18 [Eisenibacter elegans]
MATKISRRQRIKRGIRKKISGTAQRPRMSVFRSNSRIYVQLIDDVAGRTLASASSIELKDTKGFTLDVAKAVGQLAAKKALEQGIDNVIFDRNGYLYHGKVKALAEGAREAGLKF